MMAAEITGQVMRGVGDAPRGRRAALVMRGLGAARSMPNPNGSSAGEGHTLVERIVGPRWLTLVARLDWVPGVMLTIAGMVGPDRAVHHVG